jgi:hypothetical protein
MFRLELAIIRWSKMLQETAAFFILMSLWSLPCMYCFVYGVITSLRRVVLLLSFINFNFESALHERRENWNRVQDVQQDAKMQCYIAYLKNSYP